MRSLWLTVALLLSSTSAWALSPKQVYKKAGPAVVLILGSDGSAAGSAGTGSVVTEDGRIITNAHVVINEQGIPFKALYVFLKPPKLTGDNSRDLANRYRARVLAFSDKSQLDLALLQIINPPPNLPTIQFADPDHVEIGDEVVAIGHPEQGGLWTLTTGTVSTVIANFGRVQGKNVFQTEASVNRGNSGGPLLDNLGNMVGINTMIARKGAGGIAITGVNFSLKSSVAVKWLAGTGVGLAYAPPKAKPSEALVLAVPADTNRPAAAPLVAEPEHNEPVATAPSGTPATTAKVAEVTPVQAAEPEAPKEPIPVKEPPPATIVIAREPPAQPAKEREEGKTLGTVSGREKVTGGKKLDPAKAKPKYHTQKRPIDLAELRRQQMKELEDMMEDMRGKIKSRKSKGLGLW